MKVLQKRKKGGNALCLAENNYFSRFLRSGVPPAWQIFTEKLDVQIALLFLLLSCGLLGHCDEIWGKLGRYVKHMEVT